MRGGHSLVSRNEIIDLISVIEKNNCILISKHQTQDNGIDCDSLLSKEEVHDRDYKWLIEADFGIFEISNPSLGTGGEISDMANMKKPILCLYKEGLGQKVSAYIQGKANSKHINSLFKCCPYRSLEEVEEILRAFIKELI